jgi:hypothetical protein
MGKKFAVALALVALMAAPAFASVQNVKVSGDLKTTSIIRNNFDLGTATNASAKNNRNQNVVLSQTNLNVAADLTDNVSTKIGLNNERLWGTNGTGAQDNTVKLETAYVTMKELLYAPLTMTIGRQPLAYGNQLVIGNAGWNNTLAQATDLTGLYNFDAVKAVLSYDPLTVDLFASKIYENKLTSDGPNTNSNLYGVNANYKLGDKMSTVVEGYTFVKTTDAGGNAAGGNTKDDAIYVPGLRVSTNPIEGLNVQLEGAYQFGTVGFDATPDTKKNLSAYALQGMVNYALPVMKNMTPVLSAGLTYLSGENEPDRANNTKIREWQVVYGNQFVGTIWNTLFAQKNLAVANLAVELKPVQDLTAKLSWYGVNLAQRVSTLTLNQPDSTTLSAVTMNGKKNLGNELDLDLSYAYTEDVKLGMSAGYYAPGKGLSTGAQDSATQLLSSVSVAF